MPRTQRIWWSDARVFNVRPLECGPGAECGLVREVGAPGNAEEFFAKLRMGA
jgi:hypothetical protein